MSKPRRPRGIGAAGARLWTGVVDEFDMDREPHKLAVLEAACRVADRVSELEAAMDGEPLTVKGSVGQMVIHPLIGEVRAQRALLAQLLGRLGLPDSDEEVAAKAQRRTESARKAAQARWRTK